MTDGAQRRQVILFTPLMGYYSRVSRDLPLALLAISRYLHPEYAVTIVDQKVPGWQSKLDEALERGAVCFGTTSTTGRQIHYALEASRYVKERSDMPVVWGGIHATMLPRQTLESPYVDMVLAGQADESFNQLVRCLDNGSSMEGVPGLWRKCDGRVIEPQAPPQPVDLNSLPLLPYEVLDPEDYRGRSSQLPGNVFDLEVGRGCPYRCTFCYNSSYRKGNRQSLSAERIIEHIRHLKTWTEVDGISLIDDNFLLDSRRVLAFIELLKRENLRIKWYCSTDINELKRMDDATLAGLEEVGLRIPEIGVESGSPRILKLVNKRLRIEDVLEVNRRLAKFKFTPHYNFLCGFIWETKAELRQTTSLFLQLLKDNPEATTMTLGVVVPYPGTRYLEMAKEHGFVMPDRLEGWAFFNFAEWADHCPWLDRRKRKLFKALYVASLFVDRKASLHVPGRTIFARLVRLFARMYRPIARWRYRHCFGGLGLDVKLFELAERFVMK